MTVTYRFLPEIRHVTIATAVAALALAGSVAIDTSVEAGFIGQASAQQTGSPGGSGNQGTSTGPGPTGRTSNQNQNRAGGQGGGGGADGVPAPADSPTGGMTTQHDMAASVKLAPGWCDDVGEGGVDDAIRLSDKNLARLEAVLEHVGGAPAGSSPSERRALFAEYQRALEAKPADLATAAASLAVATTVDIAPVLIADVNALLCVAVSDQQAAEITTRASEHRSAASR